MISRKKQEITNHSQAAGETVGPGPATSTPDASVSTQDSIRLLVEADLLLNEGLKRIAGARKDLPDACNPIEEALALSETQTMNTLEALDRAQAAVLRIEQTQAGFIDAELSEGFFDVSCG